MSNAALRPGGSSRRGSQRRRSEREENQGGVSGDWVLSCLLPIFQTPGCRNCQAKLSFNKRYRNEGTRFQPEFGQRKKKNKGAIILLWLSFCCELFAWSVSRCHIVRDVAGIPRPWSCSLLAISKR